MLALLRPHPRKTVCGYVYSLDGRCGVLVPRVVIEQRAIAAGGGDAGGGMVQAYDVGDQP